MIKSSTGYRLLASRQGIAALAYVVLIGALCATPLALLWNTVVRVSAADADRDTLARLQRSAPSQFEANAEAWPPGSPFLDGTTITLASAALLQRMTSAISRAGGTVVSSEIEPQQQPKDNYLKATAICEVSQASILQQILYDLEAGMPFLFVDHLVVEASPQTDSVNGLRVRVTVSGLWPGTK